jgi:hypothetical protein
MKLLTSFSFLKKSTAGEMLSNETSFKLLPRMNKPATAAPEP